MAGYYYYQGEGGVSVGPVGEAEIKGLFQSGAVSADTLVIKEGGKKWRRYEESFWVPPPVVGEEASAVNWRDAQAMGACPLCGNPLLATQKSLGAKKGVRCPNCNGRFPARKLKDAEPAEAYVYRRSIWELFFSLSGRAGIKEFWLYGVVVPMVLAAGVFAMPGLVSEDKTIWGCIVLLASGLPVNVKRWHDHNLSGWVIAAFAAAWIVPGLAVLAAPVYLWFAGFRKGEDDVNRFGPSAESVAWILR